MRQEIVRDFGGYPLWSLASPFGKRNHFAADRIGVPDPDFIATQYVLNFPARFDRNPCPCFWRIGIATPRNLSNSAQCGVCGDVIPLLNQR
jgi:hypothetical protein